MVKNLPSVQETQVQSLGWKDPLEKKTAYEIQWCDWSSDVCSSDLSQNTGVGSLSLLQGIFPTQGLNPGLKLCRWILYQLSHKET